MGAIADFKKRRAAERAQQANVDTAKQQVSKTKEDENYALALLAALLGVAPETAIEAAKEFIDEECLIIRKSSLLALQKEADDANFESDERLGLLTDLLGCEEENAIEQAKELVEKGAYIAGLTEEQLDAVQQQIGVDLANGEDKSVLTKLSAEGYIESVTELAKQTATDLEQSAGAVEGAADAVTGAAASVEGAAADLEDTASQLAYSAESIGQATAELQEATKQLKKPSVAPKSSRGSRAARQKSNLTK